MLICHCRAVNDRAIRDTIAAGARAPEDVAVTCGAGSGCGGCIPAVLDLLAEAVQPSPASATQQFTAA